MSHFMHGLFPQGSGVYLLLPIHFVMGPIHGAIVNWGGHKYGYTNYDNSDNSRNSLPLDFITMGELMQNNHHNDGQSVNFAYAKWYEIDLAYQVIRVLGWLKIIQITPKNEVTLLSPAC